VPAGARTHGSVGSEGRTDDMMIIRGVNVFPREIESTILEEPRLNGSYAIVVDRRGTMAGLEVHAEVADPADVTDELRDLLHHRLASRLRLNTQVAIGPPGSLPRTAVGKVKRVYTRTGAEDPLEAARGG
jgi:phenylacetate-CoA ligase